MAMAQRLFCIIALLVMGHLYAHKPPTITLVIVVDELAYWEIEKVKSFLKGGLHFVLEHGINYANAQYNYSTPETAAGHATISTATSPRQHGVISNTWVNKKGTKVYSDDDSPECAAVFSPTGFYDYGKSSRHMMVDGLSDQFMIAQRSGKKHAAIALSHKSRAATALASKMGKAFWLDVATGYFTSSKAYFNDQLPEWVKQFNSSKKINELTEIHWKLCYPENSPAYNFKNITNYTYSGSWGFNKLFMPHMAGTITKLDKVIETEESDERGRFELFARSPQGSKHLIDFSKAAIDEYLDNQHIDHLLLWVSTSSLDKIGHPYGPDSLEAIDSLYHIDRDINDLITYVHNKVGAENVLIAVTGDHGVMPIPELVRDMGYIPARRIYIPDLITKVNERIAQRFNITHLITHIKNSELYFDQSIVKTLSKKTYHAITKELKKFLRKQPGIKRAWTFKELENSCYQLGADIEAFYKNQLFKGRSGDMICQTYPYCMLIEHSEGASHTSPYNYDTHVPLCIYRKDAQESKHITEHVWMQQLPVSLAFLMNISKPSASPFNVLPGITRE